jgi:membrane-associated protease RseP (regulator of RpoE activity)
MQQAGRAPTLIVPNEPTSPETLAYTLRAKPRYEPGSPGTNSPEGGFLDGGRRLNRRLLVGVVALAAMSSVHSAAGQSASGDSARQVRTLTFPPDPRRGMSLGFSIAMNPGPHNEYTYPYVVELEPGSAAARAGLAVGDTILASDGNDVRQSRLFPAASAGKRYVLRVRRDGEERELTYVYPSPPATAPPSGSKPPE